MSDKKDIKPDYDTSINVLRQRMETHLDIIHQISGINEKDLSVKNLLREAITILHTKWSEFGHTCAKALFDDQEFATSGFRETEWGQYSEAQVGTGKSIHLALMYLTADSYIESEPFLNEDQRLLNSLTAVLSSKIQNIRTQHKLDENQKIIDNAYKLAQIGTWEYDMISQELSWSTLTKEVHGFDEDHIPDVEHTINLFKAGYDREVFAKAASDAIEREIPFDIELKIISGKGDERWIRATGEPEYKNGKCIRFYGFSQNVTKRKQAEEYVQLSEQRFKSLVQEGADMIAILDTNANYTYMSSTVESVLGFSASELVGECAFDFIHAEDRKRLYDVLSFITSKTERIKIEPYRFKNSAGEWRWLETTITDMRNEPAVGGLVANSKDVTEREIQRQQLLDSLNEKETLLSEVHHRVKNNLAVVVGLLQLQGDESVGREEAGKLQDCVNRIQTMSQIHEQLYQSSNFSKLNFAENIRRLMDNIFKTFKSDLELEIDTDIETIQLNINQAIPCSLIINEVLTNIMKHAFLGGSTGKVTIQLSERESIIRINIGDNGIGLPANYNVEESTSLGMTLITVLSAQLNARYKLESSASGTGFSLEFKKERPGTMTDI